MNHIMYGGMQSWYFTHLIGLTRPPGDAGAGYKSIRVAPQVPAGLAGAALRLETDGGEIRVQWSQGNATATPISTRFALSVTVPLGVSAQLCVPTLAAKASAAHVTESGKPIWAGGKFAKVDGCTSGAADAEGAAVCFDCGSGSYALALIL